MADWSCHQVVACGSLILRFYVDQLLPVLHVTTYTQVPQDIVALSLHHNGLLVDCSLFRVSVFLWFRLFFFFEHDEILRGGFEFEFGGLAGVDLKIKTSFSFIDFREE